MNAVPSGAFHVRHDLTPPLAREVLLLLRSATSANAAALLEQARARDYALGRLSGADKVLASLRDLGFVTRGTPRGQSIELTSIGRVVANVGASDPLLFAELVHIRYWRLWSEQTGGPGFGWAYRLVASTLWECAPATVDADRLTTTVLTAAEDRFGLRSVSFSRSSVLGILHWVRALTPKCIDDQRKFTRRAAAAPEAFLLALEAARRDVGIPPGVPTRVDVHLRQRVSEMLLIDPEAFDEGLTQLEEGYGVARLREPGVERILVPTLATERDSIMEILN